MAETSHDLTDLRDEVAMLRALVQVLVVNLMATGALKARALAPLRDHVAETRGRTPAGRRLVDFVDALG